MVLIVLGVSWWVYVGTSGKTSR